MVEKRVNPRVVFLLVLLIAVGVFLLYSRLTFTGFVVSEYFTGTATLNNFSSASVFENTRFDEVESTVVLDNVTLHEGVFTSPLFAAPNETEVVWNNFAPNIVLNPSTSSAVFYYRACNDINCTDVDFIPINLSNILIGRYFQYKAVIQTSAVSPPYPKLYSVSIDYHTQLNLPIVIDSPQNVTYNNETVLLKITADSSAVWFYNGTDNETYLAEFNKTFSEGNYVMTAWVGDAYGNVNSTSVNFAVWFPRAYYRFANNVCSAVTLILPQKTVNDYLNSTECQSRIVTNTSTTTTTSETTPQECTANWECEDWGECVDGVQTRICTDTSTCTAVSEPPIQEQSCVGGTVTTTGEVTETTAEETSERGFLTTVGSAISAPFTYMFGNRTRIFIFSGALLLVIAGFLVFRFSPEMRLRVLKMFNIRKRKAGVN